MKVNARLLHVFRLSRHQWCAAYGLQSIRVESVRPSESGAILAAKDGWRWLLTTMANDAKWLAVVLLVLLTLGCEPEAKNYDAEARDALTHWTDYQRTNKVVAENVAAIKQAAEAYRLKPSRDTAAELVTLIEIFTTEPVP